MKGSHFPYAPEGCGIKQANRADDRKKQAETSSASEKIGYSRLKLIANVYRLSRIYLRARASPEVNFRSRFLDPLLVTDEDGIKQGEDAEGVECLDCASSSIFPCVPFPRSRV